MSASLNVPSASAVLLLWSDCPHHPSSMGAEPTVLQATWREQAHRARRTSLETCHVATHGSQWPVLRRQPMKHSAKKSCASHLHTNTTHNKCRCVRELEQFDRNTQTKKIARFVARHQVACQNIADGGLSQWRQMHYNVSAFKVRIVLQLCSEPPIHP